MKLKWRVLPLIIPVLIVSAVFGFLPSKHANLHVLEPIIIGWVLIYRFIIEPIVKMKIKKSQGENNV